MAQQDIALQQSAEALIGHVRILAEDVATNPNTQEVLFVAQRLGTIAAAAVALQELAGTPADSDTPTYRPESAGEGMLRTGLPELVGQSLAHNPAEASSVSDVPATVSEADLGVAGVANELADRSEETTSLKDLIVAYMEARAGQEIRVASLMHLTPDTLTYGARRQRLEYALKKISSSKAYASRFTDQGSHKSRTIMLAPKQPEAMQTSTGQPAPAPKADPAPRTLATGAGRPSPLPPVRRLAWAPTGPPKYGDDNAATVNSEPLPSTVSVPEQLKPLSLRDIIVNATDKSGSVGGVPISRDSLLVRTIAIVAAREQPVSFTDLAAALDDDSGTLTTKRILSVLNHIPLILPPEYKSQWKDYIEPADDGDIRYLEIRTTTNDDETEGTNDFLAQA